MPKVSGLTPIDQNTTTTIGGRLPQRLPVQDPTRMPGLQAVAQPTDTYVRPGAQRPDDTLMRIADSLQSLAPGLAEFGSLQARQAEKDAPGKATQKLFGRTPAEQRDILAADPALQTHTAQKLGHGMLGQSVADDTLNEMRSAYSDGTFNRQSGNFDQFVNGYIRRDLDGNTDPTFAEQYRQRMAAGVDSLKSTQAKFLVEQQVQDQDQLLYNSFKSTLGQALDKGATPEQAFAALRSTMGAVKTVANRPLDQQDDLLVTQLGRMTADLKDDPRYAEKFKLISGILAQPRTDPHSGQQLGSLLDSTTLGGKAADVQKAAERAFNDRSELANSKDMSDLLQSARNADPQFGQRLEASKAAHPTWWTPDKAVSYQNAFAAAQEKKRADVLSQRLELNVQNQKNEVLRSTAMPALQGGRLQMLRDQPILDKEGKPAVYSADDQRKDAVAFAQADIDNRYAGQDDQPAQGAKFAEEAKLYSENGITNDAWKRQLQSGTASASTIVARGGPVPPNLAASYQLYLRLHAANPQLLAKQVDEKDQHFYELARIGEQSAGLDRKQALGAAAMAMEDPSAKAADPSMSKREVTDKARSALSPWFGSSLAETHNGDEAVTELTEAATLIHSALKIPMKEAIGQAAERVGRNYTVVNGTAVRIADRSVPPDFGTLANRYVDQWAEDHAAELAKLDLHKGDITIMGSQNSGSTWQLMVKGFPAPLELPGANFDVSDLHAQADQIGTEKAVRDQVAFDRRYEPTVQIGNPDSRFSFSIGPTREAIVPMGSKRDRELTAKEKAAARTKYQRDTAARAEQAQDEQQNPPAFPNPWDWLP